MKKMVILIQISEMRNDFFFFFFFSMSVYARIHSQLLFIYFMEDVRSLCDHLSDIAIRNT